MWCVLLNSMPRVDCVHPSDCCEKWRPCAQWPSLLFTLGQARTRSILGIMGPFNNVGPENVCRVKRPCRCQNQHDRVIGTLFFYLPYMAVMEISSADTLSFMFILSIRRFALYVKCACKCLPLLRASQLTFPFWQRLVELLVPFSLRFWQLLPKSGSARRRRGAIGPS